MFIVRTIDITNTINDIDFNNKDDAFDYYQSVSKNGLRSISVLDKETSTVLYIKVFDDDTTCELKDGELVRLKPEYRTENEAHYVFAVSDINENTERCSITCMNGTMMIPSKETVSIDMIKTV